MSVTVVVNGQIGGGGGGGSWGTITGTLSNQTDLNSALNSKQSTLVSGTNIKTINSSSILGSGNLTISGSSAWGSITGTLSSQTDLNNALNSKQSTLVSGTNIKTINSTSLLGSGDISISAGGDVSSASSFTTNDRVVLVDYSSGAKNIKQSTTSIADLVTDTDLTFALLTKQDSLVSGTNIKTINSNSILGSGDITIGGSVAWGSVTGTLSSQTDLNSALNGKQSTLVSGTNIKTINSTSLLGSGDISISTGADTIQTKTASSESAGSVDLSLGHRLELNCDADFSLSIIDTTKMTAGYTYKVDCKNTKSPSGNVTGSIPTGWVSSSYSTIIIETSKYVRLELWKSSTGLIHLGGDFGAVL